MPSKSNAQALLDLSDPAHAEKRTPDFWTESEVWGRLTKNKLPPWKRDITATNKSSTASILSFVNKYWALEAEERKDFLQGSAGRAGKGKKGKKGKVKIDMPDNDTAGRAAFNSWLQGAWKTWSINDVILGELTELGADPWSYMEDEGTAIVRQQFTL